MNVEWVNVKRVVNNELTASRRMLETCPHEEIDVIRGRIQAYQKILRLGESEVPEFVAPNVSSM